MKTKYFRQFEKYYNNEMTPGEKEQFEKSLALDQDLNASFKEYLSIYDAIGDRETLDLRSKLREITGENLSKKNKSDFLGQGYNWLWMAALITVIISFTTIVYLMMSRIEMKEKLASELGIVTVDFKTDLERELLKFEQRNADFKSESPGDSIFFNLNEPILFKWTVNSTNPLILELINQEGKIIFSSGKYVESPYLLEKPLPGGIMVYRFRTETEAYYMGFLCLR